MSDIPPQVKLDMENRILARAGGPTTAETPTMADTAIEALAEVWASIDGKLDGFLDCKALEHAEDEVTAGGYYSGYFCEAEEMIKRLNKRGYVIAKLEGTVNKQDVPRMKPEPPEDVA